MDKLHRFAMIKMIESLEHGLAGLKSMLMHMGSETAPGATPEPKQPAAPLGYTTDQEDDIIARQIKEVTSVGEEVRRRVVERTPLDGSPGQG